MKASEFRKLIREEVGKVLKEENNLEYTILTGYPKETLQALSKHIDVKKYKPIDAGGAIKGQKMYYLKFTADKSLVQVLGKDRFNFKAPFDKLLKTYNTDKPEAPKTFNTNEASEIGDHFSAYNVTLTSSFNLEKFAKYIQQGKQEAETLLLNLEDDTVMEDIAKGKYTTFDMFDDTQFNDSYNDMMKDLGIQSA